MGGVWYNVVRNFGEGAVGMKELELAKEVKQEGVGCLQEFFQRERGEEISDFQASLFMDFIVREVGPYFYNQAIEDAHVLMRDRIVAHRQLHAMAVKLSYSLHSQPHRLQVGRF